MNNIKTYNHQDMDTKELMIGYINELIEIVTVIQDDIKDIKRKINSSENIAHQKLPKITCLLNPKRVM